MTNHIRHCAAFALVVVVVACRRDATAPVSRDLARLCNGARVDIQAHFVVTEADPVSTPYRAGDTLRLTLRFQPARTRDPGGPAACPVHGTVTASPVPTLPGLGPAGTARFGFVQLAEENGGALAVAFVAYQDNPSGSFGATIPLDEQPGSWRAFMQPSPPAGQTRGIIVPPSTTR